MTTQNTINWNPPATHYIYCADLYCPDCAKDIERDLIGQGFALCQGMDDSDNWPVPYSQYNGESDTPDHCGNPQCSRFLGRNLTDDGIAYVKEKARELAFMALPEHHCTLPSYKIVKGWCDFYGIELEN